MKSSIKLFLFFLVMSIPSGIFVFFTSSAMGYPRAAVGLLTGVVLVVGLTLLAVGQWTSSGGRKSRKAVSRVESADAMSDGLPAWIGWAILLGFLVIMGAAVAIYTLSEH